MIIRGVNVFPSQIEELILRQPDLAPHYQCVITRPGHLDELTVRVETTLRFCPRRHRRPQTPSPANSAKTSRT